jgi:hypothetical protein
MLPMDAWTGHMRRGDFAAAWELSDAVLRARNGAPSWHLPRHEQSIWNGAPLAGKRVLVRCYHGLGDTVQFIRYAPLLAEMAAEVIVWVQPELQALVRTVRGVDRVLPLHDGTPDAEFDADVEIMELPHICRTHLGSIPAAVPYLHVDPGTLPAAPPNGASRPNLAVGLVWQGGNWDARRSIPASLAARLAKVPGVSIYVLQRGKALADWPRGAGTVAGSDDVTEAARLMRSLGLIISIDSLPAHLAGALGVPVWTLLPADADWRWLEDRADTPWYPTMRLFRQAADRPGGWDPVIARVEAELTRAVAPRL